MKFIINYSCVSHIGKCRKINQDNYICISAYKEPDSDISVPNSGSVTNDVSHIFGVFDGMGGEAYGEIAAYIAAKTASTVSVSDKPLQDLSDYCKRANSEICNYAKNNRIKSMGTTAAMLAFTKDGIGLCNIGDTKIFRFSDNCLGQISKDHIMKSSYYEKSVLLQNLGIPEDEIEIKPFFAQGRYKNGDIFMICSDGLTDMVSKLKIERVLNEKPNTDATEILLDMALKNGGKDNITILICKIIQDTENKYNEMLKLQN